MQLPCVTTRHVQFSKGDAGFVKGSSSLRQLDADQKAQERGRELSDAMLPDMDAWLKQLRCAQGCDIGLIYVGPPSATPSSEPVVGTGPNREIIGYSWKVAVVGTLIVDCHRPRPGGTPHRPGTGLPEYEGRHRRKKRSIRVE